MLSIPLRFLSLASVAAFAIASPALAVETGSSPVKVTSCVVASASLNNPLVEGLSRTNGVTVVIVNTGAKTASAVTIIGTYHGRTVTDVANVALAPGKSLQLTRSYTPSIYQGPDASCRVTHVVFDDGTSWSTPGQ
jgi:hypothetical protein